MNSSFSGSDRRLPSPRPGPHQADRRPQRPDRAVPAGPLHLRLPQRPGDARYPQEAVVADGRRGAADVAGERAAEEVQRHEARARSVAAAAILREREANHLLHALSVSVCCAFIIRGSEKSQVRQCLDFCTADFLSSLGCESAVQKPKHCLILYFSLPLFIHYTLYNIQ